MRYSDREKEGGGRGEIVRERRGKGRWKGEMVVAKGMGILKRGFSFYFRFYIFRKIRMF